jgi:hypothetical protein
MSVPTLALRRNPLSVLVHAALSSLCVVSLAQAANCTVNTNTDDPATASATVTGATTSGTLRDCILAANLLTGATGAPTGNMAIDTSSIAGQTITLGNSLPLIFNNTTIGGTGAAVVIDGGSTYRIFFTSGLPDSTQNFAGTGLPNPDGAQAINVGLSNLTLQNGIARGGDSGQAGGGMGAGGALFVNQLATVTLTNVSFAGNAAQGGNSTLTNSAGSASGGGGSSGSSGGGGLGGNSVDGGGGGGGIGTDGAHPTGGSFGGTGTGQISNAQGFAAGFGGGGQGVSGGIGGGGGYNFGVAGNGGFGGGGGMGGEGGSGGAGGFGGGGGGGFTSGGTGGFGGGGGNAGSGGNGGFGGGGGGLSTGTNSGGVGAGGGGVSGTNPQGGGGAALGGAVFVRAGGSLTVQAPASGSIGSDSVTAGTGLNNGAAAGSGMFLMSGATTTFDIAGTYTISDSIADDSANSLPGGSYTAGSASGAAISKQGAGTLVLSGSSPFSGGTTISAGTLQVDGSIGDTTINGGTLSGVGNVGNVTLNAGAGGGSIAPGDSPGMLSMSSLTWNGGSASTDTGINFQLGATNSTSDSDLIQAPNLNKGTGTKFIFHFSDGNGAPTTGTVYTLISTFSTTFAPDASDFSFDYTGAFAGTFGGTFSFAAPPPPSPGLAPTPIGALQFTVTGVTPVRLQSFEVD